MATRIFINVSGGLVQDVMYEGEKPQVFIVDWDNDGQSTENEGLVKITNDIGREQMANVYEEQPAPFDKATDVGRAVEAYLGQSDRGCLCDGKLYVAWHHYEYGGTGYVFRFRPTKDKLSPDENELVKALEIDLEPDRDEWLGIDEVDTIVDLTK